LVVQQAQQPAPLLLALLPLEHLLLLLLLPHHLRPLQSLALPQCSADLRGSSQQCCHTRSSLLQGPGQALVRYLP
jgi:hypothetical protein